MQTILVGDVRDKLRELPDQSVHCCVTSPPYFQLRDYGVDGQIGLEPTLSEFLAVIVNVFREVHRVLRDDGTLWLNIGDSYASSWPCNRRNVIGSGSLENGKRENRAPRLPNGLKEKDLMMVPARMAIALQEDGWYVRSDIIWAKKSPMPESVTDRPSSAHEHIFLLTKKPRYFYDADAVRTPALHATTKMPDGWDTGPGGHGSFHRDGREKGKKVDKQRGHERKHEGFTDRWDAMPKSEQQANGANLRNVWHLGPEPFPDAHFATFVTEIPRLAIKAGTSDYGCCEACGAPWVRQTEKEFIPQQDVSEEKRAKGSGKGLDDSSGWSETPRGSNNTKTIGWAPDCQCDVKAIPCTVLDPFLGSGTTLLVADQLGRNGIGVELNPAYAEMARKRISGDAPMFANVSVSTNQTQLSMMDAA